VYDAKEQIAIRDSLVAPAGVTHYVHDIFGNVIAETAGGGATGATGTVREYIWLYETEIAPTFASRTTVDRPLAVVDAVNTASPATWWVSVDHLNRPVKMTNSAKAAVWTAVWQPWGAAQSITGSATLNARFPGQWFQVEAGLHYNWHRHYDPSLGRYTQPDPLGFVDGPSVYGYADGQPQQLTDFTGQNPYTLVRVVIAGGATAITACMRNERCRKAIEKVKDKCEKLRCEIKRERADHRFASMGGQFCEHYRITCWLEGERRIFSHQVPLPGRCFKEKQKELGAERKQ
jgi:RHS repeat-associated protein